MGFGGIVRLCWSPLSLTTQSIAVNALNVEERRTLSASESNMVIENFFLPVAHVLFCLECEPGYVMHPRFMLQLRGSYSGLI